MSSSYYLNKKNQYKNIRGKIQNTFTYFDSCTTSINTSSSYLEKLVLDNKSFDDGKLNEALSNLVKVKENMQILINECDKKIAEYDSLYQNALVKEKEETTKNDGDSNSGGEAV